MAYNPLAGGLLTGAYGKGDGQEGLALRRQRLYQRRYWSPRMFELVDALRPIADASGIWLVDLSYAWLSRARAWTRSSWARRGSSSSTRPSRQHPLPLPGRPRARRRRPPRLAGHRHALRALRKRDRDLSFLPTTALPLRQSDLDAALARFAEDGYARLGPVLAGDAMAALRARADDIMLGRVVHDGLFFQHDAPTGRYEDLEFGKGWDGPRASTARSRSSRGTRSSAPGSRTPCSSASRAALVGDAVTLYRATLFTKAGARRHGAAVAPGRRELLGARPRSRAPDLDGARRRARRRRLRRGVRREPRGGLATPLGGRSPTRSCGARRRGARRPAPRRARRSAAHPQPPLAPLGRNTTARRAAPSPCAT